MGALKLEEKSTEQLLVERLLAGDQKAWTQFDQDYGRLIWKVINKYAFLTWTAREDLHQDLYLELCRPMSPLRLFDATKSKLSTFIHRIVWSRTVALLRQPKTRMDRYGRDGDVTMLREYYSSGRLYIDPRKQLEARLDLEKYMKTYKPSVIRKALNRA